MKTFIEQVLHQQVEILPYEQVGDFPLSIQKNYDLYQMLFAGVNCILAAPIEEKRLSELRSHHRSIERISGRKCVLYLKKLNSYSRDKMIEEGIPFVWENKQVYMPFVGILLQENELRTLKPCRDISFLTQRFLLKAIYEDWNFLSVTAAADKMNVSKMSISRVYDEIEDLMIPVMEKKGRTRRYIKIGDKRTVWNAVEPFLRYPLVKEYFLQDIPAGNMMKSGISALSAMSMLGDNAWPTYAVSKYQVREYGILQIRQVPRGENPVCVVQELGYCIPFRKAAVIDPLTTFLLLRKDEDPRVEKALEEMLEEYVW